MTLERVLIVAAVIFCIGLYGVITRKNAIVILMSLELMFNAVNISAVAMSRYILPASLVADTQTTSTEALQFLLTGHILSIFVITVAAAEVALGLAIIIAIYRSRENSDVTEINLLKY